jgi:hypothetical protein
MKVNPLNQYNQAEYPDLKTVQAKKNSLIGGVKNASAIAMALTTALGISMCVPIAAGGLVEPETESSAIDCVTLAGDIAITETDISVESIITAGVPTMTETEFSSDPVALAGEMPITEISEPAGVEVD